MDATHLLTCISVQHLIPLHIQSECLQNKLGSKPDCMKNGSRGIDSALDSNQRKLQQLDG